MPTWIINEWEMSRNGRNWMRPLSPLSLFSFCLGSVGECESSGLRKPSALIHRSRAQIPHVISESDVRMFRGHHLSYFSSSEMLLILLLQG